MWYLLTESQIMEKLLTTRDGITGDEALERQRKYGKNEYAKPPRFSVWQSILNQYKDLSMVLLSFASLISFVLAFKNGEGMIEPSVISGIIIMNVTLTVIQEKNAEKALDELSSMNTPTCIVLRDGMQEKISKDDVVPGDIVMLRTGDMIPADVRLISTTEFEVDESALTGESDPVAKSENENVEENAPLADRKNMAFSNCYVTRGHANAVVIATGMETEMGKIASYLNQPEGSTPLQKRLNSVINKLTTISIVSSLFLFSIGVARGENVWDVLLASVLLAVAATPEMLSLIVTLSLTHGIKTVVKKNALIRKLHAVETLGNVSVICSDKTGTLTKNEMTVKKLWTKKLGVFAPDEDFDEGKISFLHHFAMASNIHAINRANPVFSNPTESAIIKLFFEKNHEHNEMYIKIHEIPFSSERKMMTVVYQCVKIDEKQKGKENSEKKIDHYLVLTKGAVDKIPFAEITDKERMNMMNMHDKFANEALRVISLGVKKLEKLPENLEEVECNLEFEGFVGIMDPPRPDVKEAISVAKRAGIKTIMITGDHENTASAIAKEIGIMQDNKEKVMTGRELSEISDEYLYENVKEYAVYARVSPEDKYRIVNAWQKHGEIVAMTGDGINDAPAMKKADVGISMGQGGSEVAKNASDLVLTDNNFSTIMEAIREGRKVYSNITKIVCFLVTCCAAEIVTMFIPQLLRWGTLMRPVMILMIDLLGTGLPGLYFSREIPDRNLMLDQPIGNGASFINKKTIKGIVEQVILISLVVLSSFYIGRFVKVSRHMGPNEHIGQTMAFFVLGASSILHIFNIVSDRSIFKRKWKKNTALLTTSLLTLSLMITFASVPAIGNYIVGSTKMAFEHFVACFTLSFIPLGISEIKKNFSRE